MANSQTENLYGAGTGRQDYITGGGAATDASFNNGVKLQGVALAEGTYVYRIPVAGNSELNIVLKPQSITGSAAVTGYLTLRDGITQKGATDTLTVPSGTLQVVDSVTPLCGERFYILKIVVTGGPITFSQAEYSAL